MELLPFGSVMAYQLKRRGFNVKNLSHKELVALYYNEFVSNKENQNSPYKPISSYEFRNNTAFKIHRSDSFNGDLESAVNQTHFAAVSGIVDRIVKYFKISQLKKRYAFENGQNIREALTDDELIQASATDRVMSHLEASVLNDKPVNQGQIINLIFWIGIVIMLWYILE
jgi:predicted Ser/Thr protein kinase